MILALALLAAVPAVDVLRTLQSTVSMRAVTLSRDGKRVAWMEKVQTPDGPAADESLLYVQDLGAAQPRKISAGRDGKDHEEDEPVFSPDGERWRSSPTRSRTGQPQLYVADAGHRRGPPAHPGQRPPRAAALVARRQAAVGALPRGRGGRARAARPGGPGDRGHRSRRSTSSASRSSRRGRRALRPSRPRTSSSTSTPGAPTAPLRRHRRARLGRRQLVVRELFYALCRAGRRGAPAIKPALQICEPTWSPDGKRVAFIEGLMSDEG